MNDFDTPVRILVNDEVFEGKQMRPLIAKAIARAKEHQSQGNSADIQVRAQGRDFERAVYEDVMERLGEPVQCR